jgi:purine-binding chemotaxis protein CheW
MSEPGSTGTGPSPPIEGLSFATEATYLHAMDRATEQATETFLAVEVAHEVYGVPTAAVREIIKVGEITEVPRTPRYLLGVISVRGAIIPVLDLRLRLGFSAAEPGRSARIVIIQVDDQRLGLRVEDVIALERFRASDVEAAPAIFGGGRVGAERYVQGVGRAADRPDRIVIFLELTQLADLAADLTAYRAARRRLQAEPALPDEGPRA